MKLIELHEILTGEVKKLASENNIEPIDIEKANAITGMSKQIINNANVILKAERQGGKARDTLIG